MGTVVAAAPTGRHATRALVERDVRRLAAVACAGAVVGFTVVGWGSRLAMMLLARLNPQATGLTSDDGFVMGTFDLGATAGLVAFGTIVGVLGGVAYLALRPLRFGPVAFQWAGLIVGPTVVVGNMLIHADGIDFRILAPLWLAVGLFLLLPALSAVALVSLCERWLREDSPFLRARLRAVVPGLVPLAPVAVGMLGMPVGVWLASLGVRTRTDVAQPLAPLARWAGRSALTVLFVVSAVGLAGTVADLV